MGKGSKVSKGRKEKTASSTAAFSSNAKPASSSFPPNLLEPSGKSKGSRYYHPIECLYEGRVWIQRGFFSPAECQAWLHHCHDQKLLESYTHQRATRYMAHRECYRYQCDDSATAAQMFRRLEASGWMDVLHTQLEFAGSSYRPVGCNPNLRLYKYEKGMSFGKHVDGSNRTVDGKTEITLLVYLTDCEGGATRFYGDVRQETVAFTPQAGAVLLHVHGDRCLEHEAEPVLQGVKYVLRSDVVYTDCQ